MLELSGFKLTDEIISELVASADVNGDGVIEYDEFVPMMVSLIPENGAQDEDDDDHDGEGQSLPALQDVPPEMLEKYFMQLFESADTNGDGVLEPEELERMLELSGFNLDADTISELMDAVDANQDGVIEYEEFVPMMASLIPA